MKYCICLFALAAALLGPVLSSSAAERQFQLAGEGSLLFDPQQTLEGTFAAAGVATNLGRWTNAGTIAFVPGAEPEELEAQGEVTFTAADGSELHATFTGVLDLETGVGTGIFVWDGGTGRFADAEGDADMVILQDPDGSFAFTLDGTISY